ncbi:MAG: hypothetical protein IT508_04815, partial [Burkholderiaceae bacterium]|nr:hypothetical protein [Burkholderiaceae bacterium]
MNTEHPGESRYDMAQSEHDAAVTPARDEDAQPATSVATRPDAARAQGAVPARGATSGESAASGEGAASGESATSGEGAASGEDAAVARPERAPGERAGRAPRTMFNRRRGGSRSGSRRARSDQADAEAESDANLEPAAGSSGPIDDPDISPAHDGHHGPATAGVPAPEPQAGAPLDSEPLP